MSSSNETELRETIRSVFSGKPVERVELFGSAARGGMTPRSDLDKEARGMRNILVHDYDGVNIGGVGPCN